MDDRIGARKEFILDRSPARIRRLAAAVEAVCDPLVAGDAEAVHKKLDEVSWMIGWALPGEVPDVQSELVELHLALPGWDWADQGVLDRLVARDHVIAWAERLRWLASRLEATSS